VARGCVRQNNSEGNHLEKFLRQVAYRFQVKPVFGSGSCSEIYREKAFESSGLQPSQRLEIARELGETSLMFLVHTTLTKEDMKPVADMVEGVMGEASLSKGDGLEKRKYGRRVALSPGGGVACWCDCDVPV
jgi:dTDP-4-amino-4,6-dideoxygalactose transaminase